ncbi:MAG: NAD-dependent epimerase/dehydratase family protein [Actinomycetota bacterium]
MKILIAGVRSALGSRAAQLLRADGHEVVGLSRTASGPGFVSADVLDPVATKAAVQQTAPEAIIQTLNALPKNGPRSSDDLRATARLRIEGTRNLIAAAEAAGVTRYVAENFFFVYGTTAVDSPPVAEDYPIDKGSEEARSEDIQVREFGGVVLRCGLFYGPGVGSTEYLEGLVRRRRVPVVRGARNKGSYVHIDDAAAAVVAALNSGKPGSAYNIADDQPVGAHEFIREFAHQLGAPAPLAVPLWVVRLAAGKYMAAVLSANLTLNNAKARRELGWAPAYPTIADGLKTVVG